MTSSHETLIAFLVFCIFIAKNPSPTNGFGIRLIPIDDVDRSLFPENLTLKERYQRFVEITRARVNHLELVNFLSSGEWKQTTEYEPYTLQPRLAMENRGYFITSLTVGSHSYTPYLLVDTGSADTWMQCEGCTKCFPIRQGNFNRLESKSYRTLPCNDSRCFPRICIDQLCMYKVSYVGYGGLNCYSKGANGLDTFGFPDSNGVVKRFPDTAFGCGLENHKFPWEKYGQNNNIAGFLGLGTGPRSILWQYRNETKMRISYCLPPKSSPTRATVLHFGDEAQIRGSASTTHLHPMKSYAINVEGISVGGRRLKIDPKIFRMKRDRTCGFILDMGSPVTVLVQTAYTAVRNKMIQFFQEHYKLVPQPSERGLDLCYNVPKGPYSFPTMTFHFEGADLFLNGSNIFQIFDHGFCLMMMPTRDGGTSLLGSFQQANYRFLFDFWTLKVSFIQEVCH